MEGKIKESNEVRQRNTVEMGLINGSNHWIY